MPSNLIFKQLLISFTTIFPHVELIDAFSIFYPCTLPSDEKELATRGQKRLEVLTTFGGASSWDIDVEDCTSERECLKRLIHNNCLSLTLR